MILVTGGAGFIGSAFIKKLNQEGISNIFIVDRLGKTEKWKNLVNLKYEGYFELEEFEKIIKTSLVNRVDIKFNEIIHFGACSSTMNTDASYVFNNNYSFSRLLYIWAMRHNCRFIYASSAATYGLETEVFSDSLTELEHLKPVNIYGYSKHAFDCSIKKELIETNTVGLKFFNVFGPNEYHKGEMSSMIYKLYNQMISNSYPTLFKDGTQQRDFIYIKDVVDIIYHIYMDYDLRGIYNVGTGISRSFNNIISIIRDNININTMPVQYIDMPLQIKNVYQHYTEADISKLRKSGYYKEFMSLEDSIADYIQNYLSSGKYI